MFFITTTNWVFSFVSHREDIQERFVPTSDRYPYNACRTACIGFAPDLLLITNVSISCLLLEQCRVPYCAIKYVITDAFIVWRSWVICRNDGTLSRALLKVTLGLLFVTAGVYL